MEFLEIMEKTHRKNKGCTFKIYQYPITKAWLEHYERQLNVGIKWDPQYLSYIYQTDHPPLERPPIPITSDIVKKVISKMKFGKAAGPIGVVVEMTRAAVDTGVTMIRDLAIAIIRDGKVPADWEQSFIVCLFKGKGDIIWTEATIED